MQLRYKKWLVVEKSEISHFLFFSNPLLSTTQDIKKIGFENINSGIAEYSGKKASYLFPSNVWRKRAREFLKDILKNPEKIEKINKEIEKLSNQMFSFGNKLLGYNFNKISNNELAALYNKFEYLHNQSHYRRLIMWVMEVPDEVFSQYVIREISKQIKKLKLKFQAEVVYAVLATPTKRINTAKEQMEFLQIVLKLLNNKLNSDKLIRRELQDHYKKYCWLPYGMTGPAWPIEYFIKQAKKYLLKNADQIYEEYNLLKNQLIKVREKQKKIISSLKPSSKLIKLINISKETVYIKGLSNEALFFGFYACENLLKEIGDRLGISINLVRCLLPWEINIALKNNYFNKKELIARSKYSVLITDKGKAEIMIGETARNFMSKLKIEVDSGVDRDTKILKGHCAQPGRVRGVVKIIKNSDDIKKMRQGDILISPMTDPEIIAAMKKAAAIITDTGGITCHAAIVSRELGIPCVIGTKYATKLFKDGDKVEVDADRGMIKKI